MIFKINNKPEVFDGSKLPDNFIHLYEHLEGYGGFPSQKELDEMFELCKPKLNGKKIKTGKFICFGTGGDHSKSFEEFYKNL